jgi:tricorn protease
MNYRYAFCAVLLALDSALVAAAPAAQDQPTVPARLDARMMRQPAVSATQIAFVYAGDIWVVDKGGGVAVRLSSPKGEESFPRFSPDGSLLAFSGDYDGNEDIYVMPVSGGLPRRITHHGAPDRMLNWYPDGKSILYATSMTSPKNRFNQLYRVSAQGGLPEKLPVPYGEFGAISPDGKTLAYVPISVDFRTWKRYRGGMNPDIWLFDLQALTARNLTRSPAADSVPMWHGDGTLYFLSDRDDNKRFNIWACDLKHDRFRQVTFFKEFDVHFPSIGPNDIVFENAGRLYLLDLQTEKAHEVEIRVVTDRATLKPRYENVSGYIQDATVSPSGKRALFAARGDIFSAPAEHGVVRNLTRTPGIDERYPAWSPDGKWIACFSDRTGEYELTVLSAEIGVGTNQVGEQTVSKFGPGFRYAPQWSPDSKKIAFIDNAMRINLFDFMAKTNLVIGRQLWTYHDELQRFALAWSADSRWIAWAQDLDNRNSAIALYDCKSNQMHQVTSGFYNDETPVFDPDGKYLFFRTGRTFSPSYSGLDPTWIYANLEVLAAVPLRKGVVSPLAPRNDEEGEKDKDKKEESKKDDEKKPAEKPAADKDKKREDAKETASKEDKKDEKKKEEKSKPVEIDLAGFEERVVVLPPKPGRFGSLAAVSGKLLFQRRPRIGSGDEKKPVVYYDLEKREDKTVIDDADGFELSANREKLLLLKGADYAIVEPKEGQKLDKKINTGGFEAQIDPVAEWRQIFNDAWRLERDYFYDPGMHGVNWAEMRQRYGKLLEDAVTRWDVNYVIGEMIGELNSSHTYRSGGDVEKGKALGVGYLGCDFSLENGAYRIKHIVKAADWDAEVRSPLLQPGLTNVHEGDYLLAVNGEPLDVKEDPWAAFQGLADKPVFLTVNDKPVMTGAREVLVQTLGSEERLRNLAWIEDNRKRVEKLSGGQLGYVYVPDTGINGQDELVRMWRAQITRPGLVIDERFNSGGQIPDRFIELLDRPPRNYWAVRDGKDWTTPFVSHFGPKAMLVNGWSGSGGDCFPFYFKQSGLGPLIGMRTWGGLIGITGSPPLMDGGGVTVPAFAIYSTNGQWIIEGHGVDPDIEVVDDPGAMARGGDPQLERAVAELMKTLRKHPPHEVKRPPYPKRPGI